MTVSKTLLGSQEVLQEAVTEAVGGTKGQADLGPCHGSTTYPVCTQVSPLSSVTLVHSGISDVKQQLP